MTQSNPPLFACTAYQQMIYHFCLRTLQEKGILAMKFFIFFTTLLFCCNTKTTNEYENIIKQQAQDWKNSYIDTLANQTNLETLIDVILLSYQITQESCVIVLAKLTAQEELLKIYTPSLTDTWHANMQVIHNDTSKLEAALNKMKLSQLKFQEFFTTLKSVGPKIIQINPQPTQTLIRDLKNALMVWGKQQHEITNQLLTVQQEFSCAIATISDIKSMFDTIGHTPEFKNSHLKEAAGCVAKTNKDIESVFAHVTQVRKNSIVKIQQFFNIFFKTYYSMLYELLTPEQQLQFCSIATPSLKLPAPDAFFV
jgi:hypothetical protein